MSDNMAALSSFLLRRASSSLIPRFLGSSSSVIHNRLLASRSLPFSTSPSLETSGRSELSNSEQKAFLASDKLSPVDDKLSFDSIEENPGDGTLTLRRKTEDEIIEIQVKEEYDYENDYKLRQNCPHLYIKFLYGDNFKKCMEFRVVVFPHDKIVIRNVTMSVDPEGDDGQVHLAELEGFLERRGINSTNLDFLVKYVEKSMEFHKSTDLKY